MCIDSGRSCRSLYQPQLYCFCLFVRTASLSPSLAAYTRELEFRIDLVSSREQALQALRLLPNLRVLVLFNVTRAYLAVRAILENDSLQALVLLSRGSFLFLLNLEEQESLRQVAQMCLKNLAIPKDREVSLFDSTHIRSMPRVETKSLPGQGPQGMIKRNTFESNEDETIRPTREDYRRDSSTKNEPVR